MAGFIISIHRKGRGVSERLPFPVGTSASLFHSIRLDSGSG